MPKATIIAPSLIALALAAAGCGSSSNAGIQAVPSAGLTAAQVATTATSSSATATSTSSTPLPAALKTKPKVVPPSGPPPKGLVVKDLIKGTGPAASSTSTVTVQYVGVLYKGGKQFDASWNDGSGQPTSLPLSGTIKGWQEGLAGMKVGGRRELIIPPSLAYGASGSGKVPANATLVFVIDLHGVS
jgi:peptidylprolyl isomerase